MADRFGNKRTELHSPLSSSEISDHSAGDHEFSNVTREILVTGDGSVTMRLADDDADLTLVVSAGTRLPYRVTHVRQASTAAVIGFW